MSCSESLVTPVEKTRQQLLYLIYGNQDVYRREAKFSILTSWQGRHDAEHQNPH
jgi:hypothetical protein